MQITRFSLNYHRVSRAGRKRDIQTFPQDICHGWWDYYVHLKEQNPVGSGTAQSTSREMLPCLQARRHSLRMKTRGELQSWQGMSSAACLRRWNHHGEQVMPLVRLQHISQGLLPYRQQKIPLFLPCLHSLCRRLGIPAWLEIKTERKYEW